MLNLILIALTTLASAGKPGRNQGEISQTVDLIELNHHYHDSGRHAYDQVIFWEWSPDHRRYHVVSWYMVDSSKLENYPFESGGMHVAKFFDQNTRCRRIVKSLRFRETISDDSMGDPERKNKRLFDERLRAGLVQPVLRSILER